MLEVESLPIFFIFEIPDKQKHGDKRKKENKALIVFKDPWDLFPAFYPI